LPNQDDTDDAEKLTGDIRNFNQQLTASIGRCKSIVDDCRSKLVANSNEEKIPDPPAGGPGPLAS
jgi:hypothetical protein